MIHIPTGVRYDKVDRHAEMSVSGAYCISVPDGWQHKERFLDLSELIYVTEGTLYLTVEGESVTLSAGDVYLIHRYSRLSGERPSVGTCTFYTVSFYCTLERYEKLYRTVIGISSRSAEAENLLAKLTLSESERRGSEDYLLDASLLLLLELLCDCQLCGPVRIRMDGILNYVGSHLSAPLTVEEIAEHFHYSSDYLSKVFRSQFGITLKQYVIERRLSVAKRLLTTSDIPIKQIGQAVGFADTVLFEKFFRYHAGVTPKRFREMHL